MDPHGNADLDDDTRSPEMCSRTIPNHPETRRFERGCPRFAESLPIPCCIAGSLWFVSSRASSGRSFLAGRVDRRNSPFNRSQTTLKQLAQSMHVDQSSCMSLTESGRHPVATQVLLPVNRRYASGPGPVLFCLFLPAALSCKGSGERRATAPGSRATQRFSHQRRCYSARVVC